MALDQPCQQEFLQEFLRSKRVTPGGEGDGEAGVFDESLRGSRLVRGGGPGEPVEVLDDVRLTQGTSAISLSTLKKYPGWNRIDVLRGVV
jgi:hypothetical protein